VSALQQVFETMTIAGCWFHYAQAIVIVKRLTKIDLRDAYLGNQEVQEIVCCPLILLLLPTGEIVQAVIIHPEIADDGQHVEGLKKLVVHINKQWINKRSVGQELLSVHDNHIHVVSH